MATKFDLTIDQGANFTKTFSFLDANSEPQDTTGYSANAIIRKHYTSINSVAFSVALSNGNISLYLTPTQSNAMVPGRFVYDIKLTTPSNNIVRFTEGIITLTPKVT